MKGLKDLFFYILSRRSQPHRTFYAKGALYGQGVPIENIVIHYGPECTDYASLDEMKTAFLETYPNSNCRCNTLHELGVFWGSLACIESFLFSEHPYCYFVQDDFVPIATQITENPIANIVSDFNKLREHDPKFQIWVNTYLRHFAVPDKSAQISEDLAIHQGLFDYGDMGLVLNKEGAAYIIDHIMRSGAPNPEAVLKRAVRIPGCESFYISMNTNYRQYFMPEKWSKMYF